MSAHKWLGLGLHGLKLLLLLRLLLSCRQRAHTGRMNNRRILCRLHATSLLLQKRTECRTTIICHVPEKGLEVMKPFVASPADRHAINAICLSGQRSNIDFLGVNGFGMPTRSVFPHRGQTIEIHTAFRTWDPGRWMNALKPTATRNGV